jgi:PBP1b-binding outer membrane lipoprotein LpoB
MKKIKSVGLGIMSVLMLMGCESKITTLSQSSNPEVSIQRIELDGESVERSKVETVGMGKSCNAQTICANGLECIESVCVSRVVQKDLVCPKNRDIVCGEKNGVQTGYLNECEAIRHGAVVLHSGLCRVEVDTASEAETGL